MNSEKKWKSEWCLKTGSMCAGTLDWSALIIIMLLSVYTYVVHIHVSFTPSQFKVKAASCWYLPVHTSPHICTWLNLYTRSYAITYKHTWCIHAHLFWHIDARVMLIRARPCVHKDCLCSTRLCSTRCNVLHATAHISPSQDDSACRWTK